MPSMGLVAPDATQQWLPLGLGETVRGVCLAVEIKAKQAENVRSWLVDPSSASFKAKFTRIRITRAATKGKKPAPAPDADYKALFSGEMKSMWRVIKAGLGKQSGPVVSCFLEGKRVRAPSNPSRVAAIAAFALAREPILRRLRVAQQAFDCLDIDGVAIVLAAPQLVGLDVEIILGCRPVGSRLSRKAEEAEKKCRCPPGLLTVTGPQTRQMYRKEAISSLYRLETTDLLDLLNNWLVSLSLDDVSIIVSAMKLMAAVPPRRQTCRKMGVVKLDDKSTYAYAVAVIDAGPKPPFKLGTKSEDEPAVVARAKAALQNL
jgi:hypothetical protein